MGNIKKIYFCDYGINGKIRVYPDQDLLYYVIKSKKAKQFCAYRLIYKDLTLVMNAIKELIKDFDSKTPLIKQSLTSFLVITYAKCFAEAEGRGTRLVDRDLIDFSEYDKEIHHSLMELRNQYVAHGGKTRHETNFLTCIKDRNKKDSFIVEDCMYFSSNIKDSNISNYKPFISRLMKYVERKVDTLYKLSVDELKNNMPDDSEFFDLYNVKLFTLNVEMGIHE